VVDDEIYYLLREGARHLGLTERDRGILRVTAPRLDGLGSPERSESPMKKRKEAS